MSLAVTFAWSQDHGACLGSVRRMAEHLGGVESHGRETPIPLTVVLDVLGIEDTLWCLEEMGEDRLLREWACECAERVLPRFERARPDDLRPREAIRVARLYARGMATEREMGVAEAAAWDARTAAWGASAARAAVSAAWAAVSAAWAAVSAAWSAVSAAGAAHAAWYARAAWYAWAAAGGDAERQAQRDMLRARLA